MISETLPTEPLLQRTVKAFIFSALAVLCSPFAVHAVDADLKPGDSVGPDNWQRVKDMVGENFLNRVKQGYTFKIKEPTVNFPPHEYVEATKKYSRGVNLDKQGELLNYVAGLPFPNIDPKDPQAGTKLAWNFYWRWMGDDSRNGANNKTGKIIRDAIERDGSERRADIVHFFIKTRGRVTLDPKPALPGYEHIDWMQLRVDEYPRDTSGTTTLEIRYAAADKNDDLYIYVPSLRRVRRAPPIERCATLPPSEFNYDDINSFNGKITDFTYRLLGEQKMLINMSQKQLPFRRNKGDYLPLDEDWEAQDSYVLEITPKDPNYCYRKKILYIDKVDFEELWAMMWDKNGNYWKEQFGLRTQVKMQDGREVYSAGTIVMVNVQNRRSTVLTNLRGYNQGYQPTLFSLATLQTVMRGGTIR